VFTTFSDKNELVAAQNFLQQAADANLVSNTTLRETLILRCDAKITDYSKC